MLRACERFTMSPAAFDAMDVDAQSRLLAYDDLRRREEIGGEQGMSIP